MDIQVYNRVVKELEHYSAKLVAVSKTKPLADIEILYQNGQRIFGENKVQELVEKFEALPKDIEWHMIGHLQRNKVKYIVPFVSLIHGVDSLKLFEEIDKQSLKIQRTIDVLLQIYIAEEESKFGLSVDELHEIIEFQRQKPSSLVRIRGLMGMATNTENERQVRKEFRFLKELFNQTKQQYFNESELFNQISMGMSGDYKIALDEGSSLVRIGSLIFGDRNYTK